VYSKELQAVLGILHDPPGLRGTSLLITNVSVDPKDETRYVIVHSLVMPLGYRTTIKYTATITLPVDGMYAESVAGVGTRTNVRYTARAISEEKTEVVEDITVTCLVLFSPFISKRRSRPRMIGETVVVISEFWLL